MTREEFREAYIEAQNGLANNLQALSNLSTVLSELTSTLNTVATSVQADYIRMNEVVTQFLDDPGNQP